MAGSLSGNNLDLIMKKLYTAPSVIVVVLCSCDGLLTGSDAIGPSDGDSVANRQATSDDADNQFVKSCNQWDKEW